MTSVGLLTSTWARSHDVGFLMSLPCPIHCSRSYRALPGRMWRLPSGYVSTRLRVAPGGRLIGG
jgi:hypothetical protein